jgi:hypothetical protein
MNRPSLNQVPLPIQFPEPGKIYCTMSRGQWDALLSVVYKEGGTLIEIEEINGEEKVVRAYRKEKACCHCQTEH